MKGHRERNATIQHFLAKCYQDFINQESPWVGWMGEPTVTFNKQKSHPCALWHVLNSQWNRQGKSHDRLSSNFPSKVSSRLQLPEALNDLYLWQLLRGCLVDSEKWVIHQRELGTDHANMCDLRPKTVPHFVYLFGKLISRNWKTKAGVEIAFQYFFSPKKKATKQAHCVTNVFSQNISFINVKFLGGWGTCSWISYKAEAWLKILR